MVQRTLASKNVLHAKGGTIFYGYLKFTPLFLMVFPGMAARLEIKYQFNYFLITT